MNSLALWRSKRKLTQEELATKAKVAIATIKRIEKNEVIPNLKTLGKLAEALEVDVTELASLREDNNTVPKLVAMALN